MRKIRREVPTHQSCIFARNMVDSAIPKRPSSKERQPIRLLGFGIMNLQAIRYALDIPAWSSYSSSRLNLAGEHVSEDERRGELLSSSAYEDATLTFLLMPTAAVMKLLGLGLFKRSSNGLQFNCTVRGLQKT
jgi:hypothetical protein